jgi:hypothetical protein
MKTLIIYDSAYGNTEKIADAIGTSIGLIIGNALGDPPPVQTLR